MTEDLFRADQEYYSFVTIGLIAWSLLKFISKAQSNNFIFKLPNYSQNLYKISR